MDAVSTTVDRENALVTRTVDTPFSTTDQVSISRNGLLQSQSSQSGNEATYSYDALGRQTGATDPRAGTAVTHYDANGRVDYTQDSAGNTTSYTYNNMGRRISVTDPLSNIVYSSYTDHGLLEKTWGSATYPVSYEFDSYGRMTKMHTYRGGTGWASSTWPASPGTADTTEWVYHEASGLLVAKKDAVGKSTTYTYESGGKLATRTWARDSGNLVTSYSYNTAGDMTGIDYSDSTPDVTFTVDRLGRQKTASSSVSSHTFAYNAQLQLDTETIVRDSVINVIDRSFDGLGRSSGFNLDSDYAVGYGYDIYGRFSSLSHSVLSVLSVANYSYLQNSDLLQGFSSSAGFAIQREYELNRNLLTNIENKFDTNTISKYAYNNDAGGRRVSVVQTGSAFEPTGDMFNLYAYNTRSEVVDTVRYFGSNTNNTQNPVGLQDWSYAYDNIGNRSGTMKANAAGNYTANALNQYTERTVHGSSDIIGSAETNVTVTVNDNEATRQNRYWYHRLTLDNLYNAIYTQVVVQAIYDPGTNDPFVVSSETGSVFVAETPEVFTYDDDGNLLSDGRFEYTWDGENRLIGVTTAEGLPENVPAVHVAFDYDYMSRRVGKRIYTWSASTDNWQLITDNIFLYDGWNLIRENIVNPGVSVETHTIAGKLNLNPNNSPNAQFRLELPDGTIITREDLVSGYSGYKGPAALVKMQPKGRGRQTGLRVDGEFYELDNAETYEIVSSEMTVNLYNDRLDRQGRGIGRWWIEIEAQQATITDGSTPSLSPTISSLANYYVWGLDLSGSLQGAGGIGGLLSVVKGTNAYFTAYDGNGNVSEYVDATGAIAAHYEYSPFGETIVATGPNAKDFAHRFSTKYFDDETGLSYYGYRFYSPGLGRWLNRDPIWERGAMLARGTSDYQREAELNLYDFVNNAPLDKIDILGLVWYGSYCGPGGGGVAIDPLDRACQDHDNCYVACGAAGVGGVIAGGACVRACDADLCIAARAAPCVGLKCKCARIAVANIFCTTQHLP